MRGHTRLALVGLAFCLLLLGSCGGTGNSISTLPDTLSQPNAGNQSTLGDEPPPGARSAAFAIQPAPGADLPELRLELGAPADASGSPEQAGQLVVSVVSAASQPLSEVICELHYDGARYTPLAAQATEAVAPLADSLCLQVCDTPGVVSLGQVALDGRERRVEAGEVLAEVLFAREPADTASAKAAAGVPVHKGALSPLLWDGDAGEFRWYYVNPGDYNQDGLVGISDLSPLGRELGAAGPFAFPTAQSVIDGNADGVISVADLTTIGQYWGNRVESYNLYASADINDVPATFDAVSSLDPVARFDLSEAQGDPLTDRLWFSYTPTAEQEGLIIWARPYAGGAEGTRSNISSTDMEMPPPGPDGFNLPPEARLSLSYEGSSVPLAVTFDASASSDPDGTIVFYEWDFQGDGLFDAFSTEAVAQHTYVQPGTYAPLVRVTDNGGLWDTFQAAEFEVTETEVSNIPPVADLIATVSEGQAPLTVGLIAAGSFDPDGQIVKYEWDFDGDGEYDLDSGADPTVLHVYEAAGSYATAVRVTDDRGATGQSELQMFILETNQPPYAALAIGAGEEFGNAPHTVHFSAAESYDHTGGIARYWWDVDGDGAFEQMTTTYGLIHTYTESGVFQARVRVEGGDGLFDTAQVAIEVNMPPEIVLETSSTSGRRTLRVDFDASASSDRDGEIVDYEWDFDGDGTFSENGFEAEARGHSTADCLFSQLGAFHSELRITDDDGAQVEQSVTVRVWQVQETADNINRTLTFSWNSVDADEYKVYRSTVPHDPAPFHVGTVAEDQSGDNSFVETVPLDDQDRWVPELNDNGTADDYPSIAPMVTYYYKVAPVVDGVEYPMSPEKPAKMYWYLWGGLRDWPDTTDQTRSFAVGLKPELMTDAQIEWLAGNYAGALDITQTAADRIRAFNPEFMVLGEQWAAAASPQYHGSYNYINEFVYGDVSDAAGYWPYLDNHEAWFVHADGSDAYHERIGAFLQELNMEIYWLDVDGDYRKYLGANLLQFLGEDHFDGWVLSNAQPFSYATTQFWPGNDERDALLDYWSPKTLNMLEYVTDLSHQHFKSPYVIAGVWDWWDNGNNVMDYSPCDGILVTEFLMPWDEGWYIGSMRFPTVMNNALDAEHEGQALILNSSTILGNSADDRMTILANYLLLRDAHTYLYYPYVLGSDRYPMFYPELAVDTGAPQDPLASAVDDYLTTDEYGTAYYRRDFENCSAIVIPDSSDYDVIFDASEYDIEHVVAHDAGAVETDGSAEGYWDWEPWSDQQGGYHIFPPGGYVVRGLPPE